MTADCIKRAFELGDVFVKEPEKDSYLSDEEYLAVLSTDDSWKRKMLRLVETLLMRFSYEVTQEIREAKWQLSDRVDFWEKLRKRLAAELEAEDSWRNPPTSLRNSDWRKG